MALIKAIGAISSPTPLLFNTGTVLDYSACKYVRSHDNKHWLLSAGLSTTNGVAGRYQRFKSTFILASIIKSMEKYPESSFVIYDTEGSVTDIRRLAEMSDLYRDDPVKREAHVLDIMERICVINIGTCPTLDDFMTLLEDKYFKYIEEHKKDFTVETPFTDPVDKTKARRTLVPLYILVDSFTQATTKAAYNTAMSHEVSDSKQNMVSASDGKAKNAFLSRLYYYSARYGVVWAATAHIGDAIDVSGRGLPRPKDIQFMRQDDKLKSVGGKFQFLMSTMYVIEKATALLTANKECQYPFSRNLTKATDISELKVKLVREKNKGAGDDIYPIVSQVRGLETGLSWYNIIRQAGLPGITDKTKTLWGTVFDPENKAQRTTLATKCYDDVKFAKSLEIIGQLLYMQQNWTFGRIDLPVDITPEALAEKLAKTEYAISDILATRSWWSYGFEEIPYMSLFDILEIVKTVK